MPRPSESIQVYGGAAIAYRELREEFADRAGFEPTDHQVFSLLLEFWQQEGGFETVEFE